MPINLKSEATKECDQLIKAAAMFIDNQSPRKAIEELLKIERENKSLIQSSPYLIAVHNINLGLAYFDLDKASGDQELIDSNLEKAVKYFSIVLDIKDTAVNARLWRAECYDFLGRFDEAKADYERVIELNPNAEHVHAFLGLLMENEGYIAEAKKLYKEALRLDADDVMSSERLNILENK